VGVAGDMGAAGTEEEVEVGPGVGLLDVIDVKAFPAACGAGEVSLDGGAWGKFSRGYVEIDASGLCRG
jgi:hypothetical protein